MKVSTVRSSKKTCRYLILAESCRDVQGQPRSRVVARLGEVSEMTDSGERGRIAEALSSQLGCGERALWSVDAAPSYGRWPPARRTSRLHLDELFSRVGRRRRSVALSDAVFAMAANRL